MQIDDAIQDTIDELYEHLDHPDIDVETKKIIQQLKEAKYSKGDVNPLADCMLAVLLIAKDHGYSVRCVFQELQKVAASIREKDWKKMPDGTYQAM